MILEFQEERKLINYNVEDNCNTGNQTKRKLQLKLFKKKKALSSSLPRQKSILHLLTLKKLFFFCLTFEEGRCRGHPSNASIPPSDPWFVNLSIWRLTENPNYLSHLLITHLTSKRTMHLQQIVKGSLQEESVKKMTCIQQFFNFSIHTHLDTFWMVQYMGEYGQNFTAWKRKPMEKCSNKQEIYHHPSSSTIRLQREQEKKIGSVAQHNFFTGLNRSTDCITKLTF